MKRQMKRERWRGLVTEREKECIRERGGGGGGCSARDTAHSKIQVRVMSELGRCGCV